MNPDSRFDRQSSASTASVPRTGSSTPFTTTRGRLRGSRALEAFIAVCVVAAATDRIDLARGGAPLVITPYIALIPCIMTVMVVRALSGHRANPISRDARSGVFLMAGFIVLAMISVMAIGGDGLSTGRVLLLLALVVSAASIVWLALTVDTAWTLRAAGWGLIAGSLVLDTLSLFSWLRFGTGHAVLLGPIDITAGSIGQDIPRLSGLSLDPNRGAFTAAVAVHLVVLEPLTSRFRMAVVSLAALFGSGLIVVASVSRSGAIAWLICAIGAVVQAPRGRQRRRVAGALMFASVTVVFVVARIISANGAIDLALVTNRLDLSEGTSGGEHLSLYRIAAESIAAGPMQPWVGAGFGRSYLEVAEVFAGSTYGNFHSLYLTALVEMGIVGLVVILILVVAPTLSARRWLALATVAFGVFYQSIMDPIFWFVISLLWIAGTTFDAGRSAREVDVSQNIRARREET